MKRGKNQNTFVRSLPVTEPNVDMSMECNVLGAILTDGFDPEIVFLGENMFYSYSNALIFRAMILLFQANKPINKETVTEKLDEISYLDDETLQRLDELQTISSKLVKYQVIIIYQHSVKRELTRLLNSLEDLSKDNFHVDVADIVTSTKIFFAKFLESIKGRRYFKGTNKIEFYEVIH